MIGYSSWCVVLSVLVAGCRQEVDTSAPSAIQTRTSAVAPAGEQVPAPSSMVDLTVAGQVSDPNGQPIEGATVELYQSRLYPTDWMRFSRIASTVADAAGNYSITAEVATMPVAQVVVLVRKERLGMDWEKLAVDRSGKLEVPLTLGPGGRLSGVVVDEAGQGVSDVLVRPLLLAPSGGRMKQLMCLGALDVPARRTDSRGRFELVDLPADARVEFALEAPGRVRFTTLPGDPDVEQEPHSVGASDVRLTLPAPAGIAGRASDPRGKGVSGVTVVAMPVKPSGWLEMAWALTGPDGSFSLEGLRPQEYAVGMIPPVIGPAPWASPTVRVKAEAGAPPTELALELSEGGLLEVEVRLGDQPAGEVYFRIAGAGTVTPTLLRTDPQGRHVLRAQPGRWRVLTVIFPDHVSDQPPIVDVAAGQTYRNLIVLRRRPQIFGTVLDAQGRPVGGATVELLHRQARVGTDRNGRFEFDFATSALEQTYRDDRTVYVRHDEQVAARVLKDEDNDPIELRLSPGVTVTGQVTDPAGTPVEGAAIEVAAFGRQWNRAMGRLDATDAQGRYQVSMLAAGLKYNLLPVREGYGQVPAGIALPAGQTGTFEAPTVRLPLADLAVAGQVIDLDGEGVSHAEVGVYGQYLPERKSQADADGRFRIEGVTAGPLILTASAETPRGAAQGRAEAIGGQQDAEIIVQSLGLSRPRPNPRVGKPLGDLSTFGLTTEPEHLAGKRVLVLFWSMTHSAAVDALRALNAQAEALAERNVAVVTVLTSTEPPDQVRTWLDQNSVALPVGRMPADPRRARSLRRRWNAIESPWLLLTDADHVVQAESMKLEDILAALTGRPATAPATGTAPATEPTDREGT